MMPRVRDGSGMSHLIGTQRGFFVPGEPGIPEILGNPGGGGNPENPRFCVETARTPKVRPSAFNP